MGMGFVRKKYERKMSPQVPAVTVLEVYAGTTSVKTLPSLYYFGREYANIEHLTV